MVAQRLSRAAPALVLAGWLCAAGVWTHGFRDFTVYTHALREAGELPRALRPLELRAADGRTLRLGPRDDGRYTLVSWMYLGCSRGCREADRRLQALAERLDDVVPARLELLSISFDPRDSLEAVGSYWTQLGRPAGWSFAVPRPRSAEDVEEELRSMGVWVVRRPDGEYNHASFFFLVDPGGAIVRVFDPSDTPPEWIAAAIRAEL